MSQETLEIDQVSSFSSKNLRLMPKKYIVLDRDGVINVDLFDYVLKNEGF